jgi:hypothetical protein
MTKLGELTADQPGKAAGFLRGPAELHGGGLLNIARPRPSAP